MASKLFSHLVVIVFVFILLPTGFRSIKLLYENNFSKLIVLIAFLLFFINKLIQQRFSEKEIDTANKVVLITGCDSGFGNQLAQKLDAKGFHVFACCLFPEGIGAKNLKEICSNRLKILPLDVKSDESVANALKFVNENIGSNVFWALVNNAGLAKGSAVDFSTIKHFKETIDVNALGPVRMTQAFLPLLKKSKGRVVNVNSILGRFPMTFTCPYTMSKHASIAFTECLSLEMLDWGVKVISIEPETFRTGITNAKANYNRILTEIKELDESIVSSYGDDYFEHFENMVTMMANWSSSDTDIVVNAMASAVSAENPKLVYKPRWSWYSKALCSFLENLSFELFSKIFTTSSKFVHHPIPRDVQMQLGLSHS